MKIILGILYGNVVSCHITFFVRVSSYLNEI